MRKYQLPKAYQINESRINLRRTGLYLKHDAVDADLYYITSDISNIIFKKFHWREYEAACLHNPHISLSNWALRGLQLQHVLDTRELMLFGELPVLKDLRQQFQHAFNVGVTPYILVEQLNDLCSASAFRRWTPFTPMFFRDVSQVQMTHVVTACADYENEPQARKNINEYLPYAITYCAGQIDPKILKNKL